MAVVKLLFEKGAELESKDKYGQTSPWWAARNRHEAMVKLLLEKGADPEPKDTRGRTPLLLASGNRCEMVVKLLREKGADNSRMAGPEIYQCLFCFSDCNLLP